MRGWGSIVRPFFLMKERMWAFEASKEFLSFPRPPNRILTECLSCSRTPLLCWWLDLFFWTSSLSHKFSLAPGMIIRPSWRVFQKLFLWKRTTGMRPAGSHYRSLSFHLFHHRLEHIWVLSHIAYGSYMLLIGKGNRIWGLCRFWGTMSQLFLRKSWTSLGCHRFLGPFSTLFLHLFHNNRVGTKFRKPWEAVFKGLRALLLAPNDEVWINSPSGSEMTRSMCC